MSIKNSLWMTGSLEWFARLGEEEVFLGKREVPTPLEEGDSWANEFGDAFRVEQGEIRRVGKMEPPQKYW